jgi:hypothetical protein
MKSQPLAERRRLPFIEFAGAQERGLRLAGNTDVPDKPLGSIS